MNWSDIQLRCPDCGGPIRSGAEPLCLQCNRAFEYIGKQLDLLPRRAAPPPPVVSLGAKLLGRTRSLSGWKRVLYDALYSHPVRFVGDRQRTHGKNAHDRVLRFARSTGPVVVDIGSGNRRLVPDVITADLAIGDHIDLRVDAHNLPFPDGVVDGLILQHVLEHVADPGLVLREASRVIRSGGRVYVEVPFIFPVHEHSDYRRWTVSGMLADAASFTELEHGVTIGPFTTLGLIARGVATHRIANPYLSFGVDAMLGWMLWPIRWLDELFPPTDASQIVAGAVYVVLERGRDAIEP